MITAVASRWCCRSLLHGEVKRSGFCGSEEGHELILSGATVGAGCWLGDRDMYMEASRVRLWSSGIFGHCRDFDFAAYRHRIPPPWGLCSKNQLMSRALLDMLS